MGLNPPTLGSLDNQLQQLERTQPQTPEAAQAALNELQQIAGQIQLALNNRSANPSMADSASFANFLNRVSQLSDRLHRQTHVGLAIARIQEILRNTTV